MLYETLAALPFPNIPSSLTSWQPGVTPMSTSSVVTAATAGYLATLWVGQKVMADRKPMQLKPLFMLHNFLLSLGSGIVLVMMLEELFPILWNHGFFYGICNIKSWTPRLEFFYMINYAFKYWEFADTFFLVVKKKPLAFLHVFHHSATMVLCYTQLNGKTSVSWVPIVANLTVHVLMYYYYFMASAGYKIWWKKYLTGLQISQFVIDLFIVYFASYSYFASEYFPNMPVVGTCSGSEGAALLGCGLLTSYLFLFIAFYKKTYNAKRPAAANAGVAAKKVAAGPHPVQAAGVAKKTE